MNELGIIRTQTGSTIDQKVVAAAWDALCDTTLLTVTNVSPVYRRLRWRDKDSVTVD
jgi:hypothetical protein